MTGTFASPVMAREKDKTAEIKAQEAKDFSECTQKANKLISDYQKDKKLDKDKIAEIEALNEKWKKLPNDFFDKNGTHIHKSDSHVGETLDLLKKAADDYKHNHPESDPDLDKGDKGDSDDEQTAAQTEKKKLNWKGKFVKGLYGATFTIFGIKFEFFNLSASVRKLLLFNGEGVNPKKMSIGGKGIQSMHTLSDVSIFDVAQTINHGVSSFAVFILVVMFFMELFETTLREAERISWERIMFIFVKLYFWRTIAAESYSLMKALLNSGDWLFGVVLKGRNIFYSGKEATTLITGAASIPNVLAKTVSDMGMLQGLVGLIICLLLFTTLIGSATAVFVPVITRAFKIIAYVSFAPIPIALCANEQTSHTGKRFIMNFMATCMEAAIILLMTLLYDAGLYSLLNATKLFDESGIGVSADLGTFINLILGMTVLNAVLAGAINLSSTVSREVIGM